MDDKTIGFNDYTEVAPPGNANAADKEKPTVVKNNKQAAAEIKADDAGGKDETGCPKPDFSEMEKSYEIVRYEYKAQTGDNQLYIYLNTPTEKGMEKVVTAKVVRVKR